MPLKRESGRSRGNAERLLEGRDAEGSFQAGSLKTAVRFHGLSPLEDRTLVEVAETVRNECILL